MSGSLLLFSSLALAVAIGIAAWTMVSLVSGPTSGDSSHSGLEQRRRRKLRKRSLIYRRFEPLVDELSKLNRQFMTQESVSRLNDSLALDADTVSWHSEEFVAVKQIEGAAAGFALALLMMPAANVVICLGIAVFIIFIYQNMAVSGVVDKASRKRSSIRMRLPFVVDLMALVMEAGGSFADGLKIAARENLDHPLGHELSRIERQIAMRTTREDALSKFAKRMGDNDIDELVFAIINGERFGTPLAKILRTQADLIRLKRSQWGEKAAAEAQVKMTFPGLIVALACMLIIATPILIQALGSTSAFQ